MFKRLLWLMGSISMMSGCTVVSVAGSVVSTTVGVAVDVVDAVTPDVVN